MLEVFFFVDPSPTLPKWKFSVLHSFNFGSFEQKSYKADLFMSSVPYVCINVQKFLRNLRPSPIRSSR